MLSSAAGGWPGSAAPLLGAGVVLMKGAVGNPFPSLAEAQVIWSCCGTSVTWYRFLLESLTFLGFTLVSALYEIANKHLIPAPFAPVASSCCSVCHKVL